MSEYDDSFAPDNGDVGDISVTVTASDGEASASDTFSVSVENTNSQQFFNKCNMCHFN